MTALDRKLARDVWHMRGQVIAICLVIACGVATLVMSRSAMESLTETRATFYDRSRFADLFGFLKRAPNTVAAQIQQIPGVTHVQTRIVREVTLDIPTLNEPAAGRLISIPEHRTPDLNDLHLRSGRYIEPGRWDEVLASEGFTLAHGYVPGDRITAVINGRKKQLTIVGIVLSPEYIYQIRPGELIPDDKRYGIFWMGRKGLGTAFDMDGAFNHVALDLAPGTSEREVMHRLDDLLRRFGGLGSYTREEQTSHRFVSDEIQQLNRMSTLIPTIFLTVAAFLLNVVLSRIVALQREQIAALKAFGYSNLAVGWHYLKLVLAVVVIGSLLGIGVGSCLGMALMRLYGKLYRFPELHFQLPPSVVALSFAVAGVAAVVGTLSVVRAAVRLPPAEAMRPEPPGNFGPLILERLGFGWLISPAARMILRHIERKPLKAAFSIVGMSLAVSILILGSFTLDAIDYLLDIQFEVMQRQDVMVTMIEPTSHRVVHEIQHLPGVIDVEPFRNVAVKLKHDHLEKRTSIQGHPAVDRLFQPVDAKLRRVVLPTDGLVLNEKLARIIGVKPGDLVTVEVLEGERPVRRVPVVATTSELLGASAYMELSSLNELLREGPSVSGVLVSADSRQISSLYQKLKGTPRVAAVNIKRATVQSFRGTIAENINVMRTFNVMFAMIIAFGVVYNTARIALSERGRDLASLRVLGFTRGEISLILLGELALLTLVSLPVGMGIGHLLGWIVVQSLDTELYRIPFVVAPGTDAFAFTVVLLSALICGLVVRRKLDTLDLVAVLKMRE